MSQLEKTEILDNQVALVTGASRGIGKAIAMKLAQNGARVIGTATSEVGAQSITDYFQAENLEGKGAVLNVTDADSVKEIISIAKESFGVITILVNNAGITKDNLLMRMSEEEWCSTLDTNLTSLYRLSKVALRGMMKAKQGRIISISSVVGYSGNPGQTNYSATKAGMIGFTKSLAREIGSRKITVNAVAPGFIDTDMTKGLPEEQQKALTEQIPLGCLGEVNDIAEAVFFLASPGAKYITGETIHVNGGMYMH